MSLPWSRRKARLGALLKTQGNEDEDGLALDRLLHGQSVIGKTSKTTEIDELRFQNKDLDVVGTLEYGQFGVIDVVNCRLDGRVYVRKSIEKQFALRTRDQCFPQFERDILLRAAKGESAWAPHLLCAFQTPTHLNLVMEYAEGGTLWDVLESSPHDGKVPEDDLRWWAPQIVSAIHWCHSQGFAHRDVKPQNLVLKPGARVLLIDFGSAAPLMPPQQDGSQQLPKRYCLVPCGTCDYISPEILRAHEEALLALEMEDEDTHAQSIYQTSEGYGLETDWWSLGAMLYEMAYGVAPFFANDIRQTYLKIMDHEKALRFDKTVLVSLEYRDLLSRLLTDYDRRLGRRNVMEITEHPFFAGTQWANLSQAAAPPTLHLPQFTYSEAAPSGQPPADARSAYDDSHSQAFAFSALFQSSSPGISALHSTPSRYHHHSTTSEDTAASFIGFSWGPTADAFADVAQGHSLQSPHLFPADVATPRPTRFMSLRSSTGSLLVPPSATTATPAFHSYPFTTPRRPGAPMQYQTLPRASTIRRSAPRRAVSDREAMKQLVDCVGMSARTKVLESGRKPRILTSFSRSSTLKKELRFLPAPILVPDPTPTRTRSAPAPIYASSEDTESEGPPSPSPSPRPGSAMSMMSRRSGTPTMTGTFSQRMGFGTASSSNTLLLNLPPARPPDGARRYSVTGSSVAGSEPVAGPRAQSLEDLEAQHAAIMHNILNLERRLDAFLVAVRGDG